MKKLIILALLAFFSGRGYSQTACCPGNDCGQSQNPLAADHEIPLNNFNLSFNAAPGGSGERVLIGNTNCTSGSSRLDVTDDNLGTGIKGYCSTQHGDNLGIHGIAFDPANMDNGIKSIGVLGEVSFAQDVANRGAGVAGFCAGAAVLTALPPGEQIGVYGNSTSNGGTWAGYFDGDVNINGDAYVTSNAWTVSDRRFKTNIKKLENVGAELTKLNGYTYTFKTEEFKGKNFDKAEHIGFIAQELQEVFPQLVKEDSKGYLAVNYQGLIPVLVEGIKEQQKQIAELRALLK